MSYFFFSIKNEMRWQMQLLEQTVQSNIGLVHRLERFDKWTEDLDPVPL